MRWVTLDDKPKSWTFYCSNCGGAVYWPQTHTKTIAERKCGYARCPWCGEPREDYDENILRGRSVRV